MTQKKSRRAATVAQVQRVSRTKSAPQPPPRPVTRRDVQKFTNYCVVLRAFWVHYQTLFEKSDLKREMLQTTANTFFRDLNQVFIEHLILQICKLTDAPVTAGKRNLTIPLLVANSDFVAAAELAKLKKIAARIEKFRDRILPARNKFISHLDLDAALGRKALGGVSVAAWRQFWHDLQDFLRIMNARYVSRRTPFYLNGVAGLSDADQLIQALKESTYFRLVLRDTRFAEKFSEMVFKSKYYQA